MWMWAVSSSPWSSSISLSSITKSTEPPQGLFPLTVSAQHRQPPRTQNDRGKGDGLTALESNAKHRPSSQGVKTRQLPSSPDESLGQQRTLSGSDVLWALKRATAEKSKKKKKVATFTSSAPEVGNGQDKAAAEYSSVRPLTIKSEWTVRLEQLEMRLRQLTDA